MRIGVRIPDAPSIDDVEFAKRAEEEWKYESIWAGELWGEEIFVRLSTIAALTSTIDVGVGVANVFSRTPVVLAMAGASIQEASNG